MAICKPNGCTPEWFDTRVQRIRDQFPTLGFEQLSVPAITAFIRLYMKPMPDIRHLYNYLMVAYGCLQGTSLECLAWLIEQPSAQNTTHALIIGQAHSLTHGGLATTTWRLILESQKRSLAELTGLLVADKWGSMVEAYRLAKTYADIANISMHVMMAHQKSLRRYQGKFLDCGVLSISQVKAIYCIYY